jgi:hypothetical protein
VSIAREVYYIFDREKEHENWQISTDVKRESSFYRNLSHDRERFIKIKTNFPQYI